MFSKLILSETRELTDPNLALIISNNLFGGIKGAVYLIVYDTHELMNHVLRSGIRENIVVGVVMGYRHNNPYTLCSGATSVGMIYSIDRGFGANLLKLLSVYTNGFITSDREHSDTVSAKKMWMKVQASGEWEEQKLNNYYLDANDNKVYVDIKPDGSWEKLEEPPTKKRHDDCQLSIYNDLDNIRNPELAVKLTGTPNAYKFKGNVPLAQMIAKHNEITMMIYRETLKSGKLPIRPKSITDLVEKVAIETWSDVYVPPL